MNIILRLKGLIAAVLTHRLVGYSIGKITGERIPAFGLTIDTSNSAVSARIKAKLFFGIYESSERRFVRKYLGGNGAVVELGSSLGVLTCLIRKSLLQGQTLVAVEANPTLVTIIERNLALNECAGNTFIEAAAISYTQAPYAMFQRAQHSTDGRVISDHCTARDGVRVPTTRLANVLEKYNLRDFVLVSDIEGAEWSMFKNDLPALRRATLIIIELHNSDRGEPYGVLLNQILGAGFELMDQYGSTCVFRPSRVIESPISHLAKEDQKPPLPIQD